MKTSFFQSRCAARPGGYARGLRTSGAPAKPIEGARLNREDVELPIHAGRELDETGKRLGKRLAVNPRAAEAQHPKRAGVVVPEKVGVAIRRPEPRPWRKR